MNRDNHSAGVLLAVSAMVVALLAGCSGETAADTTTTAPVPDSCDTVTGLVSVRTLQSIPNHDCSDWIDLSIGRAVQASTGSASVWSRRTEAGSALIVGAIHTLGQGWYGPADTSVAEMLQDPSSYTGIPRLFLQHPDGSGPDPMASPWFALYNPAIAGERNNNLMTDVLPREDFYVAVADSQKLDVSGLAQVPDPLTPGQVPLFDPDGVTLADETAGEANDGALVMLLGYPNETGELTASVGRVLGDEAARGAIESLAAAGDSEGTIAYEPEVEMILEGVAVAGMSGGPVVDRDGRLIGILVRATSTPDGVHYARAVRMTWITAELADAFESLSADMQMPIARYLEN
ncbi:MAG: trypsin-like peptidase domain-containing protein [Acidimicrobiia bacterium]|nr:trypsin-like peptidase domain-containing protein [Acidimicrobiia bacterium]